SYLPSPVARFQLPLTPPTRSTESLPNGTRRATIRFVAASPTSSQPSPASFRRYTGPSEVLTTTRPLTTVAAGENAARSLLAGSAGPLLHLFVATSSTSTRRSVPSGVSPPMT